jgi:hypothetical protein
MNISKLKKTIKDKLHSLLREESNNNVSYTTDKEHDDLIQTMAQYFDNNKPKVGIFWYDYVNNSLFGVSKQDAELCKEKKGNGTIHKLHKTFWQKQHFRAVKNNQKDSIFYIEKNYTLIPRGRIFVRPDGAIFVTVGHWLYESIDGKYKINQQNFRDLLIDEFNLPDDFEFVIDNHWDIGHGWSEEKF